MVFDDVEPSKSLDASIKAALTMEEQSVSPKREGAGGIGAKKKRPIEPSPMASPPIVKPKDYKRSC